MKVWVAAKTETRRDTLLNEGIVPLGRNVMTEDSLAHVSLIPFQPGDYALDVIGADTNRAWIFELEIPDATILAEDPSGDGKHYRGEWRVSRTPILIDRVISVIPIPNVRTWESGENE